MGQAGEPTRMGSQVSSMWDLRHSWGCFGDEHVPVPNAPKLIVQGPSPWPHEKALGVEITFASAVAEFLRLDRNDLHKGFFDYGLDSLDALGLGRWRIWEGEVFSFSPKSQSSASAGLAANSNGFPL